MHNSWVIPFKHPEAILRLVVQHLLNDVVRYRCWHFRIGVKTYNPFIAHVMKGIGYLRRSEKDLSAYVLGNNI